MSDVEQPDTTPTANCASALPPGTPAPRSVLAWRDIWAADPESALAMARAKPSLLFYDDPAWWAAAFAALEPEVLGRVLLSFGDPTQYPWLKAPVCEAVLRRLCSASEFDWPVINTWVMASPAEAVLPISRALRGSLLTLSRRTGSGQPVNFPYRLCSQLLRHLDLVVTMSELVEKRGSESARGLGGPSQR